LLSEKLDVGSLAGDSLVKRHFLDRFCGLDLERCSLGVTLVETVAPVAHGVDLIDVQGGHWHMDTFTM